MVRDWDGLQSIGESLTTLTVISGHQIFIEQSFVKRNNDTREVFLPGCLEGKAALS